MDDRRLSVMRIIHHLKVKTSDRVDRCRTTEWIVERTIALDVDTSNSLQSHAVQRRSQNRHKRKISRTSSHVTYGRMDPFILARSESTALLIFVHIPMELICVEYFLYLSHTVASTDERYLFFVCYGTQ